MKAGLAATRQKTKVCGRYTLIVDARTIAERFQVPMLDQELRPAYNIAPTQQVLTITNREGERYAELMRWGLVPSWAKDPRIGSRMINARAETVATQPAFRSALRCRRCLLPADGFYEWRAIAEGKVPMRIVLKGEELFAFAGLWEVWKSPGGQWVPSCTIITTAANALVAPIHLRMPVILPQEAESIWLDSTTEDPGVLTALLQPFPAEAMEAYPVSSLVNSSKHNDPASILPAL